MSDNSFSLDTEFSGSDVPLKHPPKLLFIAGLISVLVGTLIGVYGIVKLNVMTSTQQSLFGAAGYFLTVLVPIAFLQLIRMSHDSALKNKENEPYDVYAGQQLQSRFLTVIGVGLVCASLSITVFFWPIAQEFGK